MKIPGKNESFIQNASRFSHKTPDMLLCTTAATAIYLNNFKCDIEQQERKCHEIFIKQLYLLNFAYQTLFLQINDGTLLFIWRETNWLKYFCVRSSRKHTTRFSSISPLHSPLDVIPIECTRRRYKTFALWNGSKLCRIVEFNRTKEKEKNRLSLFLLHLIVLIHFIWNDINVRRKAFQDVVLNKLDDKFQLEISLWWNVCRRLVPNRKANFRPQTEWIN